MAKTTYKSTNKTRTIVAVGVFSAFAYICCVLFHFKLGFLSFDLKDAVMTIGAMLFGPSYGLAMSLIVALIEGITISSTGIYGFIMNVISSVVFVCVGSLIYSRKRTMTGALISMVLSTISMTAVMMLANLIITPFYTGVSATEVAAMIPTLLFPFNLTKGVFNSAIVFLLYKPVSSAIRLAGFVSVTTNQRDDGVIGVIHTAENGAARSDKNGKGAHKLSKSYILTVVFSAAVAVASLAFFIFKLGGSFSLLG